LISFLLWVCSWENAALSAFLLVPFSWGKAKGKGKVVPVHTLQAYTGSRGTAQFIPNLSTKWRKVVDLTSWPHYHQERTPTSIECDGGWAPELLWMVLEKQKSLVPAGIACHFMSV
jgi:hypothetical protein